MKESNEQPKKVGRPRSNKKKYLISCLPEHIEEIRNFIKNLHMKKFILIAAIALTFTSCTTDDSNEPFCGTIVAAGQTNGQDEITIKRADGVKKTFKVQNAYTYHLHEYECQ